MNRILILILLFSCQHLMAETIDIKNDLVTEAYSDNVKVSGAFLVGMQSNTADDLRSLHVQFPDDTTGTLCIELSSIDGKYKARLEHEINDSISGKVKVNFSSKYPDVIPGYPIKEIAILASLSKCSEQDKDTRWLFSSWSEKPSSELVLLIRSDARKDTARISSQEDVLKEVKCKKFRKSYNVSYDKFCVFKDVDIDRIDRIQFIRKNLQEIEPEEILIN